MWRAHNSLYIEYLVYNVNRLIQSEKETKNKLYIKLKTSKFFLGTFSAILIKE